MPDLVRHPLFPGYGLRSLCWNRKIRESLPSGPRPKAGVTAVSDRSFGIMLKVSATLA